MFVIKPSNTRPRNSLDNVNTVYITLNYFGHNEKSLIVGTAKTISIIHSNIDKKRRRSYNEKGIQK